MMCYIILFQKTDTKVRFADTTATFFQEANVENQITNSTNNPLSPEGISGDDSNDTRTAKEPDDVGGEHCVDVGQTGTAIPSCDSTDMIQHDKDLDINSGSRDLEFTDKKDESRTIDDEIDVSNSKNEQFKSGIAGVNTISHEPQPMPRPAHSTNSKSISTVMLVEGNSGLDIDDKQNSIDRFKLADTDDVFSGCERGSEHCLTTSLISDQAIRYPATSTEEKDAMLQQETE